MIDYLNNYLYAVSYSPFRARTRFAAYIILICLYVFTAMHCIGLAFLDYSLLDRAGVVVMSYAHSMNSPTACSPPSKLISR